MIPICNVPTPMASTKMLATVSPAATLRTIWIARSPRRPNVTPSEAIAATGAKKGLGFSSNRVAKYHAALAATPV
jgi:hypothetical protein